MTTTEYILASISVISFGLAVFSFVRTEIGKAREASNIAVIREKLKGLSVGLIAAIHSVDAIVQVPKGREVRPEELQNLARITRGQLFTLVKVTSQYHRSLESWRFGKMISSDLMVDVDEGNAEKEGSASTQEKKG